MESVNPAPPAVAEAGLRFVVVGTGLLIVKIRAIEVPPLCVGLKTVTKAVAGIAMSDSNTSADNTVDDT